MLRTCLVRLVAFVLGAPLLAQEAQPPAKPAEPAAFAAAAEPAVVSSVTVGEATPADFALADVDGKMVKFGDLRGRIVIAHFWSIKCPWEKAAEPKLLQIAADHRDAVVLAINSNLDEIGEPPSAAAFAAEDDGDKPYAAIRAHAKEVAFNHRILIDHGGHAAHLLSGKTTPHCFVFDGDGVLRYEGALDDDPRDNKGDAAKNYVRLAVAALQAGKEVATTSTKP